MTLSLECQVREAVTHLEVLAEKPRRIAFEQLLLAGSGTKLPRNPECSWTQPEVEVALYGISASGKSYDEAIRQWIKCATRTLTQETA